MTLHSVSLVYPEHPTESDRQLLKRFMELFRDTLTCPHCHNHFRIIFDNYTRRYPNWSASRFNFFMFVCRAHNTVNRSLNKPKYETVQACIERYKANTQLTPGATYRAKYMEYLIRNWGKEFSGENMIKLGQARDLRRIVDEYWSRLTDESTESFDMSADVVEYINETPATGRIMTSAGTIATVATNMAHLRFRGGRFQLG
jgi:hypothetical protein